MGNAASVGSMTSVEPAAALRIRPVEYRQAQRRILIAALELFTRHGVSGTSLQMIADHVGVSKAAIYHQFRTKEEIVVGAVDTELGSLEAALEAAESDARHGDAVEALLDQVITLAVGHRRFVGTLQHDPVIARLLADHPPFERFIRRLFTALLGDGSDPRSRVRAAMITSAIGGAVTHPLVQGMDDATLHHELFALTCAFLGQSD